MLFNAHTHSKTGQSVEVFNAGIQIQPNGFFSAGVHPWEADLYLEHSAELLKRAAQPNCIAIGEIGLDKLKGPDLKTQEQVFTEQIILSEKLCLPVIIHCVKAWNELQALKRSLKPKQEWVFHGLAKASLFPQVIGEGLMISVGAAVLKSETLQKGIITTPLNHLLLETDDAECDIAEIYQKISELKRIPLPVLENQIEENFKRVFTKWKIGLSEQNS